MSGFVYASNDNQEAFPLDVASRGYSRSRSNTIHGPMHGALRGAEPPMIYQARQERTGTEKSPKLFLDCVGIRRRSQSLSYNSNQINLLKKNVQYLNESEHDSSSENTSPEIPVSSTFPPRREILTQNIVQRPHPMTQPHHQMNINTQYSSDDSSSDDDISTDDAMSDDETMEGSFEEMHFESTRKKKHVSWRDDNELVICYSYKSDSRYYERNPFYGYGRTEFSDD